MKKKANEDLFGIRIIRCKNIIRYGNFRYSDKNNYY